MALTKILGDAGEHYTLSQFAFNGIYGAKMPDNWKSYDLVIEHKAFLQKVSVKTRTESKGWSSSKWFQWDKEDEFDILVLIFQDKSQQISSWIIPRKLAEEMSKKPSEKAKNQNLRELSWKTLQTEKLQKCKENWTLNFK